MRAIAGIYRFDGQAADVAVMNRMFAHMDPSHSGTHVHWQDGPVVLGVGLYGDVVSPVCAHQVASMPEQEIYAVADARIDNRKELLEQMGLDRHARLSDTELILRTYAKWGEQAPVQLIGDFAFAVWDTKRRRLCLGRDHFGLRVLYYYASDRFFVFASELQAVLAHPEAPRRINEVRVGLHLAAEVADNSITFYRDIERLRAGHSLTVTGTGAIERNRYWNLENVGELKLSSDEAYAAAFREVFTEAVACRLPNEGPIGAFLSGGLDSTAVTCMARNLLNHAGNGGTAGALHTFSAVFDQTPECDERPFVDATLQSGGITPHFVAVESTSPMAQIDRMLATIGEPFTAPTLYILWSLYQEAKRQGMRVVLDGLDGDTAVHHGEAYLAELAQESRWMDFLKLAKAIANRANLPSVEPLMRRYGEPYLVSLASRWRWRKLHHELRALSPYTRISAKRLLYSYVRDYSIRPLIKSVRERSSSLMGKSGTPQLYYVGIASPALIRQTDLLDRIQAAQAQSQPVVTSRQDHYRQLTTPLLPYLFEISTRSARAFGIEARHPFTDRRLVEFCYALPPQQKVSDGWTRNIVRRGLAGIIPEAIRLRGDKAQNSQAVTKAFATRDVQRLETLIRHNSERLAEYVDIPLLRASLQRYRQTPNQQDELLLWQSATLALWLRQVEVYPGWRA